MNRRDVVKGIGSGFAIALILPEIDPYANITDAELAAIERIIEKLESGRVAEMYTLKMTSGTKATIDVEIHFTDPDVIMLRDAGLFI